MRNTPSHLEDGNAPFASAATYPLGVTSFGKTWPQDGSALVFSKERRCLLCLGGALLMGTPAGMETRPLLPIACFP